MAVSASGGQAKAVEAARRFRVGGRVVAVVTNEMNSPLPPRPISSSRSWPDAGGAWVAADVPGHHGRRHAGRPMVARYRRTRAYPASLRSTMDSLRAVMTGREAAIAPDAADHSTGQAHSMPWATRPMPRWCIRPHSCCEKDPGCRPSVTTRPTGSTRRCMCRVARTCGRCSSPRSASDAEVVATIARRQSDGIVVGPPMTDAGSGGNRHPRPRRTVRPRGGRPVVAEHSRSSYGCGRMRRSRSLARPRRRRRRAPCAPRPPARWSRDRRWRNTDRLANTDPP